MLEYIIALVAILFFILFVQKFGRKKDAHIPNWPIIGMLPTMLQNMSKFHDYLTLLLKQHGGTFEFKGPWFTNTNFILTSDPMNVHHILSKKFGNYPKGFEFNEIFEILGDGIFNSDSDKWKKQRVLLLSLLTRKSFEIFLQQSIQKKVRSCLLPFLEHASNARAQVDLQDIIERFTFDSTCTTVFGFDPNFLPYKFTEVQDIACVKALPLLEEIALYRHVTPIWFWKLLNWLQIGQERKYNEAKEKLEGFLHESITFSKREEQQRCNNSTTTEELHESHCHLIKMIMMEGVGEGELIGDKFLRDTSLTLLAAGNSTITAGLCWFFWLVSTHPLVEAKIIQEIKDNCLTQEKNWITASGEELDKLVYLHGAICEALRLYPSIPFEHKCAIKSDILPSGDHISPNTKIIYSLYSMGRMENIWGEDCMEFKPERWISERGDIINVPSYKFIAFNAGPRSCLGKHISFIQMKMIATSILWNFHIEVVEGHKVSPMFSIVLSMKHGLNVNVTTRDASDRSMH